ncbi:MAG: zinc-dependent peptidase, partial [bacterium]
EVLEGGRDLEDSFNVVFHEFAHQLDLENGAIDGVPRLESRERYASWVRVLGEAFEELRRDAARRRPTLIDPYGVEDPGEFFAVAVECFFEDPVAFKEFHPALYDELAGYFHQDPARW